jgi:hypothetical protein
LTGTIFKYNVGTCGAPPCTWPSKTTIYTAPSPYNVVTKGGTSGSTRDGWDSFLLAEYTGSFDATWALVAVDPLATRSATMTHRRLGLGFWTSITCKPHRISMRMAGVIFSWGTLPPNTRESSASKRATPLCRGWDRPHALAMT